MQGEDNTALAVGLPASYTPTDIYVGVIDTTYAKISDLPVAKLSNPGQPAAGVAPTPDALAAAVADGEHQRRRHDHAQVRHGRTRTPTRSRC